MKFNALLLLIGVLLFLMFMIACTAQTASPTPTPLRPTPTSTAVPTSTQIVITTLSLTIDEDKCSFIGPGSIPFGEFRVQLIMNGKIIIESGYSLITLEAGKTIVDLQAWPSADQPSWVETLYSVHEFSAGIHVYSIDLSKFTQNAAYHGGPVYLACFSANPDTGIAEHIGSFGPFEIKK